MIGGRRWGVLALADKGAELGEVFDGGEGVVFQLEAQTRFEGGLQLDAAEAVEMEIFAEAELAVGAGRGFAGDCGNEANEDFCERIGAGRG